MAMMLFIASIRDCRSPWLTSEASGKLWVAYSAQGDLTVPYWRRSSRNMSSPRCSKAAIQASLELLKGQYALEICQIPASQLARKDVRKAHRDRRLSRGYPARYF